MLNSRTSYCLIVGLNLMALHLANAADSRMVIPFDTRWRFALQDDPSSSKPGLDDSNWRQLDVPHDWSIEGPASADNKTGGAGGFFAGGVGWYRKHFTVNDADSSKRIFIDFESVMANSDVYVNGFSLGHRPNGYVPLHYELTGHLNFGAGKDNLLAVRVDQSAQPSSRYYTGAGILGHVHLLLLNPVHFVHNSLFVTTPKIDAQSATVHVQTTVINQSDIPHDVSLLIQVLEPDGKRIDPPIRSMVQPATISAGQSVDLSQDLTVTEPKLWDLEHPQLYRIKVLVLATGQSLDEDAATFGVRSIKFDSTSGFSLNGKNIRIQGVCLHADNSCFGAAVPTSAWEQRLAALKPFGINAVRTAHNPSTPEFLDLCDRMGFLVMDEMFDCWDVAKNPFDYHLYFDQWSLTDLRDAVQRDRNHPSIILYSAGNEIHDTPREAAAHEILSGLMKEFHVNDPTRPVTQALLRPNASHDYTNGLADLLDVVGTNYRMAELIAAQQAKPTRLIIGTENHISDIAFMADHQNLAGIFLWSGVDYLAKPAPGRSLPTAVGCWIAPTTPSQTLTLRQPPGARLHSYTSPAARSGLARFHKLLPVRQGMIPRSPRQLNPVLVVAGPPLLRPLPSQPPTGLPPIATPIPKPSGSSATTQRLS
jgi:beta-galactosidase